MKELGILPSTSSLIPYTVPTIYDPNTRRIVTESFAIAKYLEEAYPDTPRLITPGTAGLQAAYMEKVVYPLLQATFRVFCFPVYEKCCMNDADRTYVRESRGWERRWRTSRRRGRSSLLLAKPSARS